MSVPGADWARSPPITGVSEDQRGTYVAIWAKTVDTQMHFNEMSVKSRQFGLGFVAAALGLGILLLSRGQEFALSIKIFSAASSFTRRFWSSFRVHSRCTRSAFLT